MKRLQEVAIVWLVLALWTSACGSSDDDEEDDPAGFGFDVDIMERVVDLVRTCRSDTIGVCVKEKALKYVDQLPSDLDLGGGVRVLPTDGVKRSSRYFSKDSLPKDPVAREEVLDAVLSDRILTYLSSHTFQLSIPETAIRDLRRSLGDDDVVFVDEGESRIRVKRSSDDPNGRTPVASRKKKKKKKGIPLTLLLQLKAAAIGALILKGVGFLALKALILAKIALTIASVMALKKILEDKSHGSSTYEVISPHSYEEHGHYERSIIDDRDSLPYKGHRSDS
ncbi:PREDICTED: uncharacterized protein LOC108566307 [Nicrophorus vespilloides]|uniref:Uncharacterized protein LOC108566307 n=1 Tax=Nicrophorus vespilloides TaxID=110193 RepID=A0ABM1N457_NICVS|nr:PREDICTED: uncharacterized protein LOC108566307 [Nicrophorus vespilloides]